MDEVGLQKQQLDTMPLTEGELEMLASARRNIGLMGGGGVAFGAFGGYFMTNGNGSNRVMRVFVTGCTLLAGGCLGFALGIQSAMDKISRQPGHLAAELKHYQELKTKSRKSGGRIEVGDAEDKEFEVQMAKEILPQRSKIV